jgi:hypothetical protein
LGGALKLRPVSFSPRENPMKILVLSVALILGILAGAWFFPGNLSEHLPLFVAGILGIVAALCNIVAILLNGRVFPTKKNQRRPYLYMLVKVGFIICSLTSIFAVASAAVNTWWPQ